MILTCTPTIDARSGFEDVVQPWLCAGGFVERTPQSASFSIGLSELTSTTGFASYGGFDEFVTSTVHPFVSYSGVIGIVTPAVRFAAGLQLQGFSQIGAGGGLVMTTTPQRTFTRGVLLRTAMETMTSAGALLRSAPSLVLRGGLVLLSTPDPTLAATFSAYVFNTKKLGTGQYTNFPFNSLFKLGQNYFGLTATGIELLAGSEDLGQPINASVLSGVSDFDVDLRKIPTDLYLEVRCPHEGMRVSVVYNERKRITYYLDPTGEKEGLYWKRIKLARGIDGTHLQIQIENMNGADFDLQSVKLTYVPRSRRM